MLDLQASAVTKSLKQYRHEGDDDTMDPTQYLQNRLRILQTAKASGFNPYPHKFTVSTSITEFIEKYGSLDAGEHVETVEISLAGRIMSKRASSSKLYFYDLHSNMEDSEFSSYQSGVKRGDIVGICGFPGKSRKGELSIFAKSLIVLAPCLHMLPRHIAVHGSDEAHSKVKNPLQTNLPCTSPSMLIDVCWQKNVKEDNSSWNPGKARNPETYTLKDQETRYRQRYLDLMLNPEVQQVFRTRARIISYYRNFLDSLGFTEV
ncbi:hypothetical protein FEM48_Zijuj11G0110800 [Ziziphus jujuba var. spinosa]|uniref:lysine--tRNA ligase n=1 Tax=Ziziphus jujuba var. spinosa TaxID=714518 RepID=A0A978UIK9_ZIZJJ|nr:hypothetical protein FEM48_Zijuj11G0110800 [Ziziphus jujuba var. spinosa]